MLDSVQNLRSGDQFFYQWIFQKHEETVTLW